MKTILSFGACMFIAGLLATVSAQTQTHDSQGNITTTEPSDKYGPGGTHETTSDKKFIVRTETYKDKNGKTREKIWHGEKGDSQTHYYDANGKLVVVVEHSKGEDSYHLPDPNFPDLPGPKVDPKKGKALVEKTEKTPSTAPSQKEPEKPKGQVKAAPTPSTTDKVTNALKTIGSSISISVGGGEHSHDRHFDDKRHVDDHAKSTSDIKRTEDHKKTETDHKHGGEKKAATPTP